MPRDLAPIHQDDESPLTLTRSPESQGSTPTTTSSNESAMHKGTSLQTSFQLRNRAGANKELNDLHPYVQTLTIADLESCVALENAAFPEQERCSREKFLYRLSVCPELCLGLFSTTEPGTPTASAPTFPHARPSNSAASSRKSVLIGHVVATKCESIPVTDTSMECPSPAPLSPDSPVDTRGHREQGRTIAVHSLAVLPPYQGRSVGKTLIKSYTQRMESSGIADRVSLLAHDSLIGFYEGVGFTNQGKSDSTMYGGGWFNMIYEFSQHV